MFMSYRIPYCQNRWRKPIPKGRWISQGSENRPICRDGAIYFLKYCNCLESVCVCFFLPFLTGLVRLMKLKHSQNCISDEDFCLIWLRLVVINQVSWLIWLESVSSAVRNCCGWNPAIIGLIFFEITAFFYQIGEMSSRKLSQTGWTFQGDFLDFQPSMSHSNLKFQNDENKTRWMFFFTWCNKVDYLGGGFKHFFFSPLFGEDSHFD